jgi:hypothetical protein
MRSDSACRMIAFGADGQSGRMTVQALTGRTWIMTEADNSQAAAGADCQLTHIDYRPAPVLTTPQPRSTYSTE